jgi:hypothetical protein
MSDPHSEWAIIEKLLPAGWKEKARELGAFRRTGERLKTPGTLLQLLLFHAANQGGVRDSTAQAAAAGLPRVSGVALLDRMETAGPWLRWIAAGLAADLRAAGRRQEQWALRPRILDGTCVQGPAVKQPDWRLLFTLDLVTLNCDWHELTDGHVAEVTALERVPVTPGDVLLGDRNFLTHRGTKAVMDQGGHILVRLRWSHPAMVDKRGKKANALGFARTLRPNQVGDWQVELVDPQTDARVPGRIVALRLPHPLAQKAAIRRAKNKSRKPDPRSIESCEYTFIFTTLPESALSARKVLELYRHRWQVELVFKRLKQILEIGNLPHKRRDRGVSWIMAKLILALLLEKLHRQAMTFSPWGYDLEAEEEAGTSE